MDWANKLPGAFDQMIGNPMFHMGLGLLGSGGQAQGALLGLNSYQQMQQAQLMNQYQQAQMAQMAAEQEQAKREAEKKAATDAWIAKNYPEMVNAPQAAFNARMQQAYPGLPTGMTMGLNGMQYDPNYLTGQMMMRGAGATQITNAPVTNNVMGGKEGAYLEARGKDQSAKMSEQEKAATSAYRQKMALQRFQEAAEKGYAGGLAPVKAALANFASSFGYDSESLQDYQYMQQAVGEILSNKMAELGARGLTDKDMEILRESLPRVDIDPKARIEIAKIMQKAADFTIEQYMERIDWEQEKFPGTQFHYPGWAKTYQPTGGYTHSVNGKTYTFPNRKAWKAFQAEISGGK